MVLLALTLLVFGAGTAVLLARWRVVALAAALLCSIFASIACVAGAVQTLRGSFSGPSTFHWPLPLGEFRLAVDGLSAWFLLMIGIVGLAAAVYSWGYLRGGKDANRAYAPLFSMLLAAMVLTVCAGDALVFLIGWEFTSLSAFFLVGLNDRDPEARYGAWTYLVATHIGTALGVLPLFAAFIARTGSTDMTHFAGAFSTIGAAACVGLFVLGVVGFGTKAGFVPFHVWLPLAHPVAPSPVSALMSGVVIKIGIYGLLRAISWLPDLPAYCGAGLLILSAASALLGILNALGQRGIKRMLAYSSVENIGIIGIGISVAMIGRSFDIPFLVACGMGGALLHALNHSLFKGLLFLSAGTVLHGTGSGNMERLGGLAKRAPGNSLAFLTGSVAICALPPLNGFLGEYLIYGGLVHGAGELPMAYAALAGGAVAVFALTGAVALVVFSKAFSVVFLGQPRDPAIAVHATPATMNAGMAILAAACFAVVPLSGFLPSALGVAIQTAPSFVDSSIQNVALSMAPLGKPLMVLLAAVAVLWGLRQCLSRGSRNTTWGCGYAWPTSAMQYTGSSYGWNMLSAFRQAVRPQRRTPALGPEYFPKPSCLKTVQGDFALDRMYRPSFVGISRFFEKLWPLQHGRIQLYLVYVVGTILFVFLVEVSLMPFRTTPAATEVLGASLSENDVGAGGIP
jgi:formate hydrogenlyase subunit 3/multisubunit Na+/H+ antiporter MnhD subunit